MKCIWAGLLMVSVGSLGGGCVDSDEAGQPTDGVSVGRLALVMVPPEGTDVVAVKVKIVPDFSDCTGVQIQTKIGLIRPDVMLSPGHPAADAFFVLPVGSYRVCVTPLSDIARNTPSQICSAVEQVFKVMAQVTTEAFLDSQCAGAQSGGLDVAVSLNRPPLIENLDILPSKLVLAGNNVFIQVMASDPDRDFLTFTFTQVSGPAMATITPSGATPTSATAVFQAPTGGKYEVRVVVTDGRGAQAALTFPILVAAAP
jgi:hypothetical protein